MKKLSYENESISEVQDKRRKEEVEVNASGIQQTFATVTIHYKVIITQEILKMMIDKNIWSGYTVGQNVYLEARLLRED